MIAVCIEYRERQPAYLELLHLSTVLDVAREVAFDEDFLSLKFTPYDKEEVD